MSPKKPSWLNLLDTCGKYHNILTYINLTLIVVEYLQSDKFVYLRHFLICFLYVLTVYYLKEVFFYLKGRNLQSIQTWQPEISCNLFLFEITIPYEVKTFTNAIFAKKNM